MGGRGGKGTGRSCWFPWKVLWNTREWILFAVSPLISFCGVCWWLSECGNAGTILRAPSQMRCIVSGYVHEFLQGAQLHNGPNLEAWVVPDAPRGNGCRWNPEELSCGGDGTEATVSALHSVGLWRARKLSASQEDVSNENRRNLWVTASQDLLVYSRSRIHLCVWAQSKAVRSSQTILQSSSVEGVVILREILSHQLLRHRLRVNMQIHLRSAVSSSLVLWALFLNQRAIVQALCWGRTKSLNFFFFITMSAFPSDWGLQLFQN